MQNINGLAGVVDSIFLITFSLMDNKHLLNRKSLKPLRSSLRNKSTSAESVLWNQIKWYEPTSKLWTHCRCKHRRIKPNLRVRRSLSEGGLKSRNLEGRKFRRQQSIGNYIVDFEISVILLSRPGWLIYLLPILYCLLNFLPSRFLDFN